MGALASLVPAVVSWVTGFFNNRQEIGKAKATAKIEQQRAAVMSKTGLLIVIFWFYPAVAGYMPYLQESAARGFELFSNSPDWYLAMIGTITVTLLGIEKVHNLKRMGK